jgi:hypothetical protein
VLYPAKTKLGKERVVLYGRGGFRGLLEEYYEVGKYAKYLEQS